MKLFEVVDPSPNYCRDLILRDCSFFLRQVDNPPAGPDSILFRGLNSEEAFTRIIVPKQRKPKDSTAPFHQAYDRFFMEEFGKPYRSVSVFCTGKEQEARSYGSPYAIFPIGEFDFCYSPVIADLFGHIEDSPSRTQAIIATAEPEWANLFYDNPDAYIDDFGTMIRSEPVQQAFVDYLRKHGRYAENSDLSTAIRSQKEIMVACNSYYAVSLDYLPKVFPSSQ